MTLRIIAYDLPMVACDRSIVAFSASGADGICGTPVVWFDYQIAEKNYMQGIVCDVGKVSKTDEKPVSPQTAKAAV